MEIKKSKEWSIKKGDYNRESLHDDKIRNKQRKKKKLVKKITISIIAILIVSIVLYFFSKELHFQ